MKNLIKYTLVLPFLIVYSIGIIVVYLIANCIGFVVAVLFPLSLKDELKNLFYDSLEQLKKLWKPIKR